MTLKYNKNYIGLARHGLATNFVAFRPRKHHVVAELKIPRSEELTERVEAAGIEVLAYRTRWGQYRVQLTAEDLDSNEDLLRDLVSLARDTYGVS